MLFADEAKLAKAINCLTSTLCDRSDVKESVETLVKTAQVPMG